MINKSCSFINPFNRHSWSGRIMSVDGTRTDDFGKDDCAEVLHDWESNDGHGWDGEVVGVARLKDGRFVAWETWWGPTGNGFVEDAYGGDADIFVGATAEAVIWFGLCEESRERIGIHGHREENP